MDDHLETIVRVANRVCWTAFLIAWVFAMRGCYEEKRRYDIIERMQARAVGSMLMKPKLPGLVPDQEAD